MEDSIFLGSDLTEVFLITVQENNQPQEEDRNSPHSSLTELFYDSTRIANRPAPIQSVEPASIQPVELVIGLSQKNNAEEKRTLTF